MSWNLYLFIIFLFGLVFFSVAVWALVWASRKGQLKDFEKGSRVIFDEEEPEGKPQDAFPGKRKEAEKRDTDPRRKNHPKGDETQP